MPVPARRAWSRPPGCRACQDACQRSDPPAWRASTSATGFSGSTALVTSACIGSSPGSVHEPRNRGPSAIPGWLRPHRPWPLEHRLLAPRAPLGLQRTHRSGLTCPASDASFGRPVTSRTSCPQLVSPPTQRGPVGTGTFNAEAFDGAKALGVVLELAEPSLISGDLDRAEDAPQRVCDCSHVDLAVGIYADGDPAARLWHRCQWPSLLQTGWWHAPAGRGADKTVMGPEPGSYEVTSARPVGARSVALPSRSTDPAKGSIASQRLSQTGRDRPTPSSLSEAIFVPCQWSAVGSAGTSPTQPDPPSLLPTRSGSSWSL